MAPTRTDVCVRLRSLLDAVGAPGAAAFVRQGGRVTFAAAGATSLENPLPVTADTLFQVGSVSKTFTATACLRLSAAGRLGLDQPVRRYLPDFRLRDEEAAATVTPRHLLTHSGGFYGDDFPETGDGDDALARAVASMAELPQLTPVGAVRSYSNSGFYVLGRLIEVLTGLSYEAALARLVLRPLRMRNSWFFPTDVMTRRFVAGHQWLWDTERNQVARPWAVTRATNPVGGLVTSVRDLDRYARFHLGQDPIVAAMREPQPPRTGMVFARGLGWALREVAGVLVVEHGGATHGQQCLLTLVPERGFAAAVLTNSGRGKEVYGPFVRWALERYLGLASSDPAPLEASPAQLNELTGEYRGQLSDWRLSRRGDRLIAVATPKGGFPFRSSPPGPQAPPTTLAPVAGDRLLFLDGPLIGDLADVLRGGDGRVEWIRFGGRICQRVYS